LPAGDRLGDRDPSSSSVELARKLESWNGDAMLSSLELLCKLEYVVKEGRCGVVSIMQKFEKYILSFQHCPKESTVCSLRPATMLLHFCTISAGFFDMARMIVRGVSFDGVYDCQLRRTMENLTKSFQKKTPPPSRQRFAWANTVPRAGFSISNNFLEFGDVYRRF